MPLDKTKFKMITICLVRHGETDWNIQGRLQGRKDVELNNNGRNQAMACAEYLKKKEPWDTIVTSPLKRAKETAFIIGKIIGINDIYILDNFIERDFGSASGLLYEEKKIKFPDDVIFDEEDWSSFEDRVAKGIKFLINKYNNKKIIVVTHAGVISSVLPMISNGEFKLKGVKLKNTCINIINYDKGKWKVTLYNYDVMK